MGTPFSAKMTLKDGYGFGGFCLAPPSKQHLWVLWLRHSFLQNLDLRRLTTLQVVLVICKYFRKLLFSNWLACAIGSISGLLISTIMAKGESQDHRHLPIFSSPYRYDLAEISSSLPNMCCGQDRAQFPWFYRHYFYVIAWDRLWPQKRSFLWPEQLLTATAPCTTFIGGSKCWKSCVSHSFYL